MPILRLITTIIFLISSQLFASPPPCKIWQVQVKEHHVPRHQRSNSPQVIAYDKNTFCREKYKNSDFWGPKIAEISKFNNTELSNLLGILSTIPNYLQLDINSIKKLNKEEIKSNPASSDLISRTIILYKSFFDKTANEQKLILLHELAHFLFYKLSPIEQQQFVVLAGWKLGNINLATKKVELIKPEKLLKADSAINPEEDFANHIEVYSSTPDQIKQHNLDIYNFLTKRY